MINFLLKSQAPILPPLILRGQRIILRPPQLADWPEWQRVRGANAVRLKPFEPRWAENALSEDFFMRRLERQAGDWRNDRNYAFLIFDLNNQLIGGVNINNVCRGAAHFASLGYWIDAGHEGQGLMHDALELLIDYGFSNLRLHRFNAAILPENARSRKLLEGLGFVEEGLAKRYLQIDGVWRDHVLFGKWQDVKEEGDGNAERDH